MLRIFSTAVALFILSFIVVLLFGYNSDPEYSKTMSALYYDKQEVIWETLIDIEKYPESKKDVKKVEIFEKNFNAISKWREIISDDRFREYEIIEKETPNKIKVSMFDNISGLQGTWTYYLSMEGDKGKITITEKSKQEDIIRRGIDVITGREKYINREFKWLRVKLFEELIEG